MRCIVSVGMLTEGWDCNTVTHIIGCGRSCRNCFANRWSGRGLRRASYEVGEDGKCTEEVAKVFGVPFRGHPVQGELTHARTAAHPKRYHVHAIPAKASTRSTFRESRATQAIRNRVTVNWTQCPSLCSTPAASRRGRGEGPLRQQQGTASLTGRTGSTGSRCGVSDQATGAESSSSTSRPALTRDYIAQPRCRSSCACAVPADWPRLSRGTLMRAHLGPPTSQRH